MVATRGGGTRGGPEIVDTDTVDAFEKFVDFGGGAEIGGGGTGDGGGSEDG